MAKAAAVRMPPEATAVHGCEGARRVLALMLAFSAERNTLSARDLAAATGIALPSVYRYITLLRETGLLAEGDRGNFRLSARLIGLARAAEAAESIIEIADPVMHRLVGQVDETVILVRLIGRSAVCVHRVESWHRLRIAFEPGQAMPLEHGASARILLAGLSPEVRRDYLSPYSDRDPDGAAALEERVVIAAQRGWAISEGEIDAGVIAMSAPVVQGKRVIAALTVSAPQSRVSPSAREGRLAQVRAAAREISAALAGNRTAALANR
jgi:DNA-binding IclR family transcriptional regulator